MASLYTNVFFIFYSHTFKSNVINTNGHKPVSYADIFPFFFLPRTHHNSLSSDPHESSLVSTTVVTNLPGAQLLE